MYGKIFQSLYEGSMVGAGAHVFAVWGYCIANADPSSHTVNLNPVLLSTIIGEPPERISAAIEYLCQPDPKSHCKDSDGRRLIPTTGMEYTVVSHAYYRDIKTYADRRAYMRDYMRRRRAEARSNPPKAQAEQEPVAVPQPEPPNTEEPHAVDESIHAPVPAEELRTIPGAVSFIKRHPAFKKTPVAALENTFKEFYRQREHWPRMCRRFVTDFAEADEIAEPNRTLRIEFSRYIRFDNLQP